MPSPTALLTAEPVSEPITHVPDIFDRQPTPMSELPDPTTAVVQLAQAIVDVLFGQRALTQLNAWVTTEVLDQLRLAQRVMAGRPSAQRLEWRSPRVTSTRVTCPAPGVIEASAVVAAAPRSRALALRLEGLDGRWRCTALRAG
ncbi:MAG: hypothetical protein QG597_1138 [Actinomycetota bacterium]|nr:hypothetical protein [Actinomycetota bacterium]